MRVAAWVGMLLVAGCAMGGSKRADMAAPRSAMAGAMAGSVAEGKPDEANAAPGGAETRVAGPAAPARMMIYTAMLGVEVASLEPSLAKVREMVAAVGGHMQELAGPRITVRIPAAEFEGFLDRVGRQIGDVVQREIRGQDVTEEFLDVDLRLRNLIATRDRIETLLARASTVKDALEIQRELARLTQEIEQLKGRLQFLKDRVALATITIELRVKRLDDASLPADRRLPFGWVRELGLHSIFDMRDQ